MNLLASIVVLLQLSASLLVGIQANPDMTVEQRNQILGFVSQSIILAESASAQLVTETEVAVIYGGNNFTPEVIVPEVQVLIIPKVELIKETQKVMSNISIKIVSNTVKSDGGNLKFKIVDSNGDQIMVGNEYRLFEKANWLGGYQPYFWTGTCEWKNPKTSKYGIYTMPFRGEVRDANVDIDDDGKLTLQVKVCGELIEKKINILE